MVSKETNFQTIPLTEVPSKGIPSQHDDVKPVVLVVDDEVVIADTLTAILARNGFATMTAYNGQSALDIARVIPPDLLLTDVVMPDMSGIDLAIAVRRATPDCKILLFSGQAATMDLLISARNAGQDFAVIAKPIHPNELLVRISESLNSRHMKPRLWCQKSQGEGAQRLPTPAA